MRVLLVTGMLMLLLPVAAYAQQGYVYQPSGLDFVSREPIQAGERLQGLTCSRRACCRWAS